jgi:hypothetical protein
MKSARRRSVPINQTARTVLIRRLAFRSEKCPHSPWVFAHSNGTRTKDLRLAKESDRAGCPLRRICTCQRAPRFRINAIFHLAVTQW